MELVFIEHVKDNLLPGFTPYDIYHIYVNHKKVGSLVFRYGTIEEHYIDGHIGYTIEKPYRGHHYSLQACLLLQPILIEKGYTSVIITCEEDNIASLKTIESLNTTYLETKPIPKSQKHLFHISEHTKRIYRWELIS